MSTPATSIAPLRSWLHNVGRLTVEGITEMGLGAALLAESVFYLFAGPSRRQPVRVAAVLQQATEIGIRALPITAVLSVAIGVMVAIQGIHTLRIFGAESQVTLGVALSVTREFSPLITGILVAGRSGSALAARLATMKINEELAALTVMGISPVRYLVAPALVAMLIMLPTLTWFSDCVALAGAGFYISADLGVRFSAYVDQLRSVTAVEDVMHGIGKSALFAVLVTIVGVVNGSIVSGGAEGVGRVTTRSVVHAIAAIVITDMIFAFLVTR